MCGLIPEEQNRDLGPKSGQEQNKKGFKHWYGYFQVFQEGHRQPARASIDLFRNDHAKVNLHLHIYSRGKFPLGFRSDKIVEKYTVSIPMSACADIVKMAGREGLRMRKQEAHIWKRRSFRFNVREKVRNE